MSQIFMMDTNTVSYILKGNSLRARVRLAALRHDQIACISAITEAELRYGIEKRGHSQALSESMEGFLAKIRVLSWGREEAFAYGQLRAKQEKLGRTLGNLDLLIAAHAIAVGAVLVTADKAFSQVKELQKILNWATDLGTAR